MGNDQSGGLSAESLRDMDPEMRAMLAEMAAKRGGGGEDGPSSELQKFAIAKLYKDRDPSLPKPPPLHMAAAGGHSGTAAALLEAGADAAELDAGGRDALHMAAYGGATELLKVLIALPGVHVNRVDKLGDTPLLAAVDKEHEEAARLLLAAGADASAANGIGDTSVHLAAQSGQLGLLQLLLAAQPTPPLNTFGYKKSTPLMRCAEQGSLEMMEALVAGGADPHVVSPRDGDTALHAAAQAGHTHIVKFLLDKGVDFKAIGFKDSTPLSRAALGGHTEVSDLLIKAGADVNQASEDGDIPIHLAAQEGCAPLIRLLLDAGSKVDESGYKNSTPLMRAAAKGAIDCIKMLLEAGAVAAHVSEDGDSAIGQAAQGGHLDALQLLLASAGGSDGLPSGVKTTLSRAMIRAAANNQLDIVCWLIENGVDVNSVDEQDGDRALHQAAQRGWTTVVDFLLRKGARVDDLGFKESTALLRAASNGHVEATVRLLAVGASVDLCGEDGDTPLHQTAQSGHDEVLQILLKNGAAVNKHGYKGTTALQRAASNGHMGSVDMLLKAGAQPDAASDSGDNPLHQAAQNGHLEICKRLVDAGSPMDKPGYKDSYPLSRAAANSHLAVVEFLLSKGALATQVAETDKDTALHQAAQSEDADAYKVCELLIQHGALLNSRGYNSTMPIHRAAANDNVATVKVSPRCDVPLLLNAATKVLVAAGADVNGQMEDKDTALHTAAQRGNAELAEVLLKAGADPNIQGFRQSTALMRASLGGKAAVVRLLLAAKADTEIRSQPQSATEESSDEEEPAMVANLRRMLLAEGKEVPKELSKKLQALGSKSGSPCSDKGETALHFASGSDEEESVEVVRLLLAAGADPNPRAHKGWTPLMRAAAARRLAVMEALVAAGADVTVTADDRDTALHLACQADDEDNKLPMIRLLVGAGGKAVLNRPGFNGTTPLIRCEINGGIEAVRFLIANGADPNGTTPEGDTVLHAASQKGDLPMVQVLLEAKARVDNFGYKNSTPLMRAASSGRTEVVKALLAAGAGVNVASPQDKDSPLHQAVQSGNDEIGLLLLAAGADYKCVRSSGDDAAHVAAHKGTLRTLTAILDKGDVHIDAKGQAGSTLLTRAAQGGHADIVRLLVDRGADRNIGDKDGDTALDLAAKFGHTDCVKILFQK